FLPEPNRCDEGAIDCTRRRAENSHELSLYHGRGCYARRVPRALALLLLVAPVACSSTSSAPPAGDAMGPAAPADDSGEQVGPDSSLADADAAHEAGGCNALVNVGAPVSGTLVAAAPPTANGGSVADGTYVLTKYQVYTGAGGPTGPTGSSLA